jgi:hypothetical protein
MAVRRIDRFGPEAGARAQRAQRKAGLLLDAIFALTTIAFFAITAAYVRGCERM